MQKLFDNFFEKLSTSTLVTGTIGTIILHLMANIEINKLYTSSKFPVPYFAGQTSFSSEKIKGWYNYMIGEGTLDKYLHTQLFDFLLIFSVVLMGIVLTYTTLRLFPKEHFIRKNGFYISLLLPIAGIFDICENIVSFFMIYKPNSFPGWLAIIYSSLAVLKFIFWTSGYILIPVLLILGLVQKMLKR